MRARRRPQLHYQLELFTVLHTARHELLVPASGRHRWGRLLPGPAKPVPRVESLSLRSWLMVTLRPSTWRAPTMRRLPTWWIRMRAFRWNHRCLGCRYRQTARA